MYLFVRFFGSSLRGSELEEINGAYYMECGSEFTGGGIDAHYVIDDVALLHEWFPACQLFSTQENEAWTVRDADYSVIGEVILIENGVGY